MFLEWKHLRIATAKVMNIFGLCKIFHKNDSKTDEIYGGIRVR